MKTTWFALVLATLSVASCKKAEKQPATPPPQAAASDAAPTTQPISWYRVEIIADVATSVPFFLGVDTKADKAMIANGEEQLEAILVSREPLRVRVAVLGGEVTLTPDSKPGTFKGEWTAKSILKDAYRVEATSVEAPSPTLRFPGDAPPGGTIAGEWKVDLKDFGVGRAIFQQDEAGNLKGSVIPPDVGDSRYLSGRVMGNRFALSTFDGMHAYLFEGTIEDGGKRLEGRWVAIGLGEWDFVADRGEMPTGLSLVTAHMKKGKTKISVPALDKPPYKGEPTIVEFFGTWCSACMDAMPEIVALEKKYGPQGLKVLMIALEPDGDREDGKRRIEELRAKYGIKWDIDVRFNEDLLADVPPEIDDALGFPLTVFVRRDGTVAGIHAAFISAAAGAEHAAIRERFDGLVKEIVASPAPK